MCFYYIISTAMQKYYAGHLNDKSLDSTYTSVTRDNFSLAQFATTEESVLKENLLHRN